MTLYQKLKDYSQSDYYPYHMPGHKRRLYGELPRELFEMDITEIDGFDNLHHAEGILRSAQEKAARLYGAEETFYLVGGSTAGVLSAVSAAVPEGGHILMDRRCHRSVYHAAYLRNLELSFLYPDYIEDYGIYEAVSAKQVEEGLDRLSREGIKADAVLVTSPTYEGRIADIRDIVSIVHAHGIPLIVDEAHGAHLGLAPCFARNSCQLGADLVIHSVHKTLPAMTQTALLHVSGDRIDRERLRRYLRIYQSSSPSYVLMASIENALDLLASDQKLFEDFSHRFREMLERLVSCGHLKTVPLEDSRQDVGKLLVSVKGTGLSGRQLYDLLLGKYHLQLEMALSESVLAMFTVGDTREGFERMADALLSIDRDWEGREDPLFSRKPYVREGGNFRLQMSCKMGQAWDGRQDWRPLPCCGGETAGDFINLYPPGVPLVIPGEILTEDILDYIGYCCRSGLNVQGVAEKEGQLFLPVGRDAGSR